MTWPEMFTWLSTFENCLVWETENYHLDQILNIFHLWFSLAKNKKTKQNKKQKAYIKKGHELGLTHTFTYILLWCGGIYMLGGREGERVFRWETPAKSISVTSQPCVYGIWHSSSSEFLSEYKEMFVILKMCYFYYLRYSKCTEVGHMHYFVQLLSA